MANTYLKDQQYINLVLAELYTRQNLSGLITPFSGEQFVGAKNDTLYWKTKGVTIARDYEFRTRTAPIVFDEVYRNELSIKLDQHMTVANKWTDEERKFDLVSVRREIAAPMATAMVERFDSKILTALQAADWAVTDLNVDASDSVTAYGADAAAYGAALVLKRKLDAAGTPEDGRFLILGANAFMWFALSPALLKYDTSNATTAFQRGKVVGKIANFTVVDGTDIIGDNDIVAVHPSWAVLANAAPENPEGLNFSVRGSYGGYSARLAAQYFLDWATDALLLNTFWGISEIKDQYARHTQSSAAAANDGSQKGDIIIVDGKTTFTGKNARGGKGTFSA